MSNKKDRFAADVKKGLTSYPKKLSSRYFYDQRGDELFQQIMTLPEYYLTRKEFSILQKNKEEIAALFASKGKFDLIELGAGNGEKTKILLQQLQKQGSDFEYLPVDISDNVLQQLQKDLRKEQPGLAVTPKQGSYEQVLQELSEYKERQKVILFLGSNIGNLTNKEAVEFLKKIAGVMQRDDLFFIGIDQKKQPEKILAAYNDDAGITAAFNLNLLSRINRELGANFHPESFIHWPTYDPETGIAKSFLVSRKAQTVRINYLNLEVHFRAWETIHTEISTKYDDASIEWLANEAGLKISRIFTDDERYFKNYILKRS